MTITFKQCPKCGHARSAAEAALPEQCPACGLYFAKWVARNSFVPPALRKTSIEADGGEASSGWRAALRDRILHVPHEVSRTQLWGRVAIWGLLLVWGFRLIGMDYRDGEIMNSFMHNILLPIHEAGHIFFIPGGEFMTILGGSLFQLLLPLFVSAALLWRNHDAFGACVGLWWTGASLIDLAPYIYDARAPQLTLLGGHTGEDGPHDWLYLLAEFGKVAQSPNYGIWAHHLGAVVMLLSLTAAAGALWRWHRAAGTAGTIGTDGHS